MREEVFQGQVADGPLIGQHMVQDRPHCTYSRRHDGRSEVWYYRFNDRFKVWHALPLDMLRDMPDGLTQ